MPVKVSENARQIFNQLDAATQALDALAKAENLTVHRTWIADDGWMSGWRCMWAVVEGPSGRLWKLHWHSGNQDFFAHLRGGGSTPWRLRGIDR